jgi:hypothetical protein
MLLTDSRLNHNMFPGLLISRFGDVPWPTRSPDLSLCDFFLWGSLKDRVYAHNPRNLNELKDAIQQEVLTNDQQLLARAMEDFMLHTSMCHLCYWYLESSGLLVLYVIGTFVVVGMTLLVYLLLDCINVLFITHRCETWYRTIRRCATVRCLSILLGFLLLYNCLLSCIGMLRLR